MAAGKGREAHVVPIGHGGMAGRLGRMLVCCLIADLFYPTVLIESLDGTKLQDAA